MCSVQLSVFSCVCMCVHAKGRASLFQQPGGSPGRGSVYLQGASSDHSLLCHLFLVNYVEIEIIKEAIIIMLPKQHRHA